MLKKQRWLVVLVGLLFIALTARLGLWQLDRAQQKTLRQAQLEARGRMPMLDSDQLARDSASAEQQHQRRIRLAGRWLAEHTVFLDNRQMGGRPGFLVITPLALDRGDAVLVQRGWVPRNFIDRSALPQLPTPAGRIELAGRVTPPPARLFEFAAAESGSIRQNLDLWAIERETGLEFAPLSVLQLDVAKPVGAPTGAASPGAEAAASQPDGLLRDWPAPTADVGKHHGYAFQWFALSALLTGLLLWFQVIHPFLRRSPT